MNKITYIFAILFLTVCLSITAMDGYSHHVVDSLSENLIRLHVVANSDQPEDQLLKLKVRDSIITYLEQFINTYPLKDVDISKAEFFVSENLDNINKIAQDTVISLGYDYVTHTQLGSFYFPAKQYEDFALPSGVYKALKIEIGRSQGENWWCVLYPPLCFAEGSVGNVPEDNKSLFIEAITDKNSKVVFLNESHEINIRFKIVEFFQNLRLGVKKGGKTLIY